MEDEAVRVIEARVTALADALGRRRVAARDVATELERIREELESAEAVGAGLAPGELAELRGAIEAVTGVVRLIAGDG